MTKEQERKLIHKGMDAIEKCVNEYHDMELTFILIEFCKAIAGDAFHIEAARELSQGIQTSLF